MAEAFLAGLIGFLIGRGVEPQDATSIVEALRSYLGFEPPLGLTGYALENIDTGKEANAAVVVRGKAYDAVALQNVTKYGEVTVLGKRGSRLEVVPVITSMKEIVCITSIKGIETRFYRREGQIDGQTTETLFDSGAGKSCVLRSLDFASNYSIDIYPWIRTYKIDGTLDAVHLWIADRTGIGLVAPTPYSVNANKSDVFDILLYDDTNHYYKIGLKKPISFRNGFRLAIYNGNTSPYNVACHIIVEVEAASQDNTGEENV